MADPVAELRERVAIVEAENKATKERLAAGAGSMDGFRQALAATSREIKLTMDADRAECRQTFTAVRRELETSAAKLSASIDARLAPKPWTFRRALSWVFGAGVPVLAMVGGAAMWLLALRDTTKDAARGLGDAVEAIRALKGDMRAMEVRQSEAAGAVKALSDGQQRAEDKLDRLLGRIRPKKDEE